MGRYCCKSRFALVVENSAGRRCDFRVKMWGASSPHVKLTGDLANVSDAIRIGDCFPFRNFAKNQSPCNFRLLQQYRSTTDIRGCSKTLLFDYLVGKGEQGWRYGEIENLGGLNVNHQLEF
jgi:hypothetical protein